ncbi:class I SAM-dependent methyltransferase [Kroppenstedtia pulmonis]
MYERKPKGYFAGSNPHILKKIRITASTVLEVGCAQGNLGAAIRARGAEVSGIELFPAAAEKAKDKLNHVLCGDIEALSLPYEKNYFDYIVFGDVLEHLKDPWAVLRKVKPFLKSNGVILACIPNVGHISILMGLLQGNWTYTKSGLLDQTHFRFFTLKEIFRLFQSQGYEIEEVEKLALIPPGTKGLIDALNDIQIRFKLDYPELKQELSTFHYVVTARPTEEAD